MLSNYLAVGIFCVVFALVILVMYLNNREDAKIQKMLKR